MSNKQILLNDDPQWYKDAIIYELHVKAFRDSNGDGIGDFKGLLEKLDYLEDLGVTAIWLLPFFPSPQRDDGYDISDYYKINPKYGNLRDFKRVVKEAHQRGMRVITELVVNHTSDQHPWFQRARKAKPGSEYRDFYVWTDDPSWYQDVRIIFQDFEESNWTWDPVAQAYYWHRFYSHQPDLNFDNPKVREEIIKVLDYWMNMGVDGFRLDAIPYLFEREGTNCENLPETHEFLKELRAHVDAHYSNKALLAEANMWPEDAASYFGNGDECHMNYHFPLMPRMFMALKMEDRYPIIDIIEQTPEIPENCQWAMFLRNHDELTLEMVTDEERDYMYKVYTKDQMARINLGIRHRLAPLLENDRRKMELMNILLLSLPGTPIIYYGDEIGMGDNYYLGDRNGVRTPMQWSSDRNAGFSSANPQMLYLPLNLDPVYQYEAVNVENQQLNPNSLLWWMKRIIATRKKFQAFGRGSINFLSTENTKILAFTRTYEDEQILVITNLSRFPQAAGIDLRDYKDHYPEEVFSQNRFPNITEEPYFFTLAPYGYYWLYLKKEDTIEPQLIDRKEPLLKLSKLQDLEGKNIKPALENKILPTYLNRCRWFGGKARTIQSINLENLVPINLEQGEGAFLILEVNYNEGLPELYILPVTYTQDTLKYQNLRENYPQSLVARITIKGEEAYLFDGLYDEGFSLKMLEYMSKKKKWRVNKGGLMFTSSRDVGKYLKNRDEPVRYRVLGAEQSNTSIVFDDQYIFKLYRKLDRMINPDLELTRFLTEKAKFEYIPPYKGHIEIKEGNNTMVLGMMQEWVPNQGDAWSYFCDVLERYYERVLSQIQGQKPPVLKGSFAKPVEFEALPELAQQMIGGPYLEWVKLLGERTAEMHLALGTSSDEKDFKPENFSLHYQRSLYSSLQTMLRSSLQLLRKQTKKLDDQLKVEAEELLDFRPEIQRFFKRIYGHKFNTTKIRNHGDYHLGQVLFTGKDFVILDFEGEPGRPYSERRIKRSALRDVAGMLRSFHYAAFGMLYQNDQINPENSTLFEQWAHQWYHYIAGFYLRAYLEKAGNAHFIPDNEEDFQILLEVFLLEKAVYELSYELNNRPDWVRIPIHGIRSILEPFLKSDKD